MSLCWISNTSKTMKAYRIRKLKHRKKKNIYIVTSGKKTFLSIEGFTFRDLKEERTPVREQTVSDHTAIRILISIFAFVFHTITQPMWCSNHKIIISDTTMEEI